MRKAEMHFHEPVAGYSIKARRCVGHTRIEVWVTYKCNNKPEV
jgi:hypothetical protein